MLFFVSKTLQFCVAQTLGGGGGGGTQVYKTPNNISPGKILEFGEIFKRERRFIFWERDSAIYIYIYI